MPLSSIFRASELSPATQLTFTNGQVAIPLNQVSDGDLHRFAAQANGTTVRFWLYQRPDGKMATVLDACQICGAVGFYKGPNGVVCKNCAAPINPQSVGMAGGCNPVPLKAEVTGDAVVIREADIAARAQMFQK
jgi:high-affinity iron transporter